MSLLTPLYLLGLAAVALPVVFHLIRRQPRGRRVFSTVMFLEPSPPRVTRRSRLDHWPLLLLRAAALCLLALAFARPFLRQMLGTDQPRAAGESIAVCIDTSASMQRDGLWADALRRVEAIVQKTRPSDGVAVLAFDRAVRPLVTFQEWSAVEPSARKSLVRERLAGIAPGWAATHLDQALLTAAELLQAPSTGEPRNAARPMRIALVTDFAEGSRLQALAGSEWPQDVSVTLEHVRTASPTNAGVQLVAAVEDGPRARRTEFHSVRPLSGRSETPSDGSEAPGVTARVRVMNAADSTREHFTLDWRSWVETSASRVAPVEVYCPPGQSRVVRMTVPDDIPLPVRLVLAGDDHEFDNAVVVDQPARESIQILHYTAEPAADPAGSRFYLEHACTAAARHDVRVTHQPPDAPGPLPVPRDVPLVIVSAMPADDHVPALRRHVESGGTLVIVAAAPETCALWNRIIDGHALAAEEAEVAGYAMLGDVDFQHLLFAPLADPRFADFTGIRVWRHRQIVFEGGSDPVPRVLARFDSGAPAIVEQPLGRGRVLLFAFGWHPADSQWALSTKFVPMLHALVGLAAGNNEDPRRLVVGDPLPLASRSLDGVTQVTVHTPDRRSVQLAAGELSFADTVVPGVYRVAARDSDFERRFTVALPPEESRTTPLPLERLEARGVRLATADSPEAAAARTNRERQLRTEELETRQKFWRWLIVAALAVLMIETWLAGRLARTRTNSRLGREQELTEATEVRE